MAERRVTYCGEFPELQARFIAETAEARCADLLSPLSVLVTGQLVRLYLRRELARSGLNHANIRFLTLTDLARRLAEPELRRRGLTVLPEIAAGPLMQRAIADVPQQVRYFGRLREMDGFRLAAWQTITELRGAGLTPERLISAADSKSIAADLVLRQKTEEIAVIYQALERRMNRHNLIDHTGLIELALGTDIAYEDDLILYGLDELTTLEQKLIAKLLPGRSVVAYLPYTESEAYEWTRPVLEWFRANKFNVEFLKPQDSSRNTLDRLKSRLFAASAEVLEEIKEDDRSLQIVSAPGSAREAETVTGCVLFSPLVDEFPGRTTGVLTRSAEPYVNLLRGELNKAGVTGYFHQCRTLRDTVIGRALSLIASLLGGDFRRDDVLGLLAAAPLRRPSGLPDEFEQVPVAEWNDIALRAQVFQNEADWQRRLKIYARGLHSEDESDSPAVTRRKEAVEAFSIWLKSLNEKINTIRSAPTWKAACEGLLSLLSDLYESDESLEPLTEALGKTLVLDGIDLPPAEAGLAGMIDSVLATPAEREGKFQIHEPAVATLQQAAGVLFDEVIIPGLVEKEFPHPSKQDPLLLDDDRRTLSRIVGTPIPLHSRRRQHERFLFRQAVAGARRRLVLTYPRLKAPDGREQLPSVFLLRTAEALEGNSVSYKELDSLIRTSPLGRFVPISRLEAATLDQPTTEFVFELSQIEKAVREKNPARLRLLTENRDLFRRGIVAERQRARAEFSEFEGVLQEAALKVRFARWVRARLRPVSPTRMEDYATCPFRSLIINVLDLQPIEEAVPVGGITPGQRGTLIHNILENFFREQGAKGKLPLTADALAELRQTAKAEISEFEKRNITGPRLLWEFERERISQTLEHYFEWVLENETEFVPHHFELKFGGTALSLESGEEILFRGRIDRVDVNPQTNTARVVDYKTGNKKQHIKKGMLAGGRALQLPVYLLAARQELKLEVEQARYEFLSADSDPKIVLFDRQHWEDRRRDFESVLQTILTGMLEGRFYPYPGDKKKNCDSCPVKTACGIGRFTSKWRRDLEQTQSFRRMTESVP